jgi:hypothetical protein
MLQVAIVSLVLIHVLIALTPNMDISEFVHSLSFIFRFIGLG